MKRNNLGLIQRLQLPVMAGLVLLGLAVGAPRAQAKSQPFSHLFVFGDSLSDTGNFYRLSGGAPPPPYAQGRFCNGPVWVEYLATSLGMEFEPTDNFAVGGATTGTVNYKDGFAGKDYPGLLDEIASFQAAGPVSEAERALFVVEAGANDFLAAMGTGASPESVIGNGVKNTVEAVRQLWGSGARFILVVNVPDLGLTPFAQSLGLGAPLTQLSAAYNQTLNLALDRLAQAGIRTIRLDSFAALDAMANSPEAYGFTDITTPSLYVGGNVDRFLFWDDVHPTTRGQEVMAQVALDQLIGAFSPSNGKGTPAARANALNGLVNANLHNDWSRN